MFLTGIHYGQLFEQVPLVAMIWRGIQLVRFIVHKNLAFHLRVLANDCKIKARA